MKGKITHIDTDESGAWGVTETPCYIRRGNVGLNASLLEDTVQRVHGQACDIQWKTIDGAGVTVEGLLRVAIHRLQEFQAGEFPCRENAIALTHLETTLLWLGERTRKRREQGVEGELAPHD